MASATYISRFSFEAETPSPSGQGTALRIPANSVLVAVDVPQPTKDVAVTTAHQVRFRYDGATCSATISEFFDVGMCYQSQSATGNG